MDFPFVKEAISQLFSKTSCDMYPVKPSPAAPHYRGRIIFHPEKCISCGMCERVCAGGAISTTCEKTEEGDKMTRTFNLGSCTFCGHCADYCNDHAIELSTDYHMVATKEEDLLVCGTYIKKKPVRKAPPAPPAAPAEAPAKGNTPAPVEKKAEEAPAPSCPLVPRDDGKPFNDPDVCVYCGICAKKCPMGAITVDRKTKTWSLDEDACISCGTCAESCPKKCIII